MRWDGYDCIEKCPCGSESTSPSTQDLWPHDFETEARELDTSEEQVASDFQKGVEGVSSTVPRGIFAAAVIGAILVGASFTIPSKLPRREEGKKVLRGFGLVMLGVGIAKIMNIKI